MRIGAQLISEGLATPDDVAGALEAQMIHGGRLGTNLVERDVLALDTLAEALARQHDMAPALDRHFERCDPLIQQRLDASIAAEWHAIPLGLISEREVAVAVTDPLSDEGLDVLSFALGHPVVPAIAPELRVLYQLERTYGVPRLNRFLRAPGDDDGTDQRRHYATTVEDSAPAPPNQLARVAIRRVQVPVTDVTDLPIDITSVELGVKAMRQCHSRSRLGQALLHTIEVCLCPPLQGAMLLTLRGNVASGWRGVIPGGSPSVVEALAMVPSHEACIARALEERAVIVAEAPSEARHVRLWAALGIAAPRQVIVAPILLKDRAVAILFAMAAGPVPPEVADDVDQLGQGLGANFERLLRAAER